MLGELIDQGRQGCGLFNQPSPSRLPTAIFPSQGAKARALIDRHRVQAILARFAAGENPGSVQFATGTSAIGFSALAPQLIEGLRRAG